MLKILRRLIPSRNAANSAPQPDAAERADWIDRTLRHAAGHAQQTTLAALRQAQRSFEAGQTPEYVASWATTAPGINDDLERHLPTMRARARNLARSNEWATRYRLQLADNVVGACGIRLQMRLRKAAHGGRSTPDADTNTALEAAWAHWGRRGNCEVTGKMTWREIELLMLWTLVRDGEILWRRRPGLGPYKFQIQILDPATLDVQKRGDYQGRRIRMGIEIDDDARPIAYWLRAVKAGDNGDATSSTIGGHLRVPASEIHHHFLVEEPDQLRGIPALAVGARRLHMLHQFEDAAAVACTNSAQRLGFFVSPTGEAPEGIADRIVSTVLDTARETGKVLTPEEISQIKASAEKYTTGVPGTFDTIPTGYDFRQYDSPWPNLDSAEYVKSQIRGWSAAQGASYVSIGNDLADVNYSSARVGILDEREHYKEIQARLISWLHDEVFAAVLPYLAAATPGLSVSKLPLYLAAAKFQGRRWQGVDPTKDATADEKNLANSLTSRSRIILARGEDPEEIAAELAADLDLFGPLPAKTAAPAAGLAAESDDESDDPDSAAAADQADAKDAAPRNFLPIFPRRIA